MCNHDTEPISITAIVSASSLRNCSLCREEMFVMTAHVGESSKITGRFKLNLRFVWGSSLRDESLRRGELGVVL